MKTRNEQIADINAEIAFTRTWEASGRLKCRYMWLLGQELKRIFAEKRRAQLEAR